MSRNVTMTQTNGSFPTSLPEEAEGESIAFKITKICFYFLILSASTFGNSMVAHIINNTRRMRTASNFLILNLAICDLVTPLLSIVFDFVLEENNYEWIYGGVMCKLLWPAQTYFTCASSLTLAAISLDRYRIIMHPFKTRLSMKQIIILICLVHFSSLVAVTPYGYVLALANGSCDEKWPEFSYRQAYTFTLFLVQYGLPLMFMVVMYSLAMRSLYNSSARTRESSITAGTPKFIVKKLKQEAKQQEKPQRGVLRSNSLFKKLSDLKARSIWNTPNARATKMFIVVVVVFAIFMFPNQVVWLWADFGGGINSPNFTKLSIICWLFTYTNCVVNPIIFGVFSKDFRKGFKKIFHSIICCESSVVKKDCGENTQFHTITRSELTDPNTAETEYQKDSKVSFLLPQGGEQTNGLDAKPNKHFQEVPPLTKLSLDRSTDASFSNQNLEQTSASSSLKPEGEFTHFNDYLTTHSLRQWVASPNYVSCAETLKNALNRSPETNC